MNRYDIRLPSLNDKEMCSSLFLRNAPEIDRAYDIESHPFLVMEDSPLSLKKKVYKIASYFRREEEYDFVQFSDTEKEYSIHPYHAWCWTIGHYPTLLAGACCFRWREYKEEPAAYYMQWIWLHPYRRNKGLLKESWPFFKSLYGEKFFVEHPYSESMRYFLKKYHTDAWLEWGNEL